LGLLTGILAPVLLVWRHWKIQRSGEISADWRRLHRVLLAYVIAWLFVFVFVYGDVQGMLPEIFFWIAVLELITVSALKDRAIDYESESITT